jgi:lipopolysaccharide export system permease protein
MRIFKMKKIDFYIGKFFLENFLKITSIVTLIVFFINSFDAYRQIQGHNSSFIKALEISLVQIPDFINDIAVILVLMATIITIFSLSSKSEITIIRSTGLSLWHVARPVAFLAFLLGIIWITIFTSLSTYSAAEFNRLEQKYINHEDRQVVKPDSGIWLKQDDIDNKNHEIIISAEKLYKQNLEFENVTLWFVNDNSEFYKRIDAKKILLNQNNWLIKSGLLNDDQHLNQMVENVTIPTNLVNNLAIGKIINNFESTKLFSLYQLPSLIKDLKSAGLITAKFEVYYHNLLSKPLLFMAMSLIGCYFGLTSVRSKNAILMIFLGAIFGLLIYIISNIISTLSISGLIPIFAATWLVAIVCLAIGTLLIYEKELI